MGIDQQESSDERLADATLELPMLHEYLCHKKVRAAKIEGIKVHGMTGGLLLTFAGNRGLVVGAEYAKKHRPQVGGYYVRYADGYESWSPAKAFEEGYSLISE